MPRAPKSPAAAHPQDKLLMALLRHVPFDGWSDEAFRKTADGKKIALADLMVAFPAGAPDALRAFADWAERQMLARLAAHKLIQLKVRERVTLAVRLWLEAMTPHREAVRAAVHSAWQPGRAALGVRNLARVCDTIWYEAGDNSTDFNYYTKRLLLGGVFTSTLIFWLQDGSEHLENTWKFLDARINTALNIGKFAGNFRNAPQLIEKAKNLFSLTGILQKSKPRAA